MNFSRACFYTLDEGAGVAVADALGNGPDGAIVGTTTNLWANAGGLTVSNAAGSAGDNAIKFLGDYIDQLCRLDNLEGSLVWMYWIKQPQMPTGGQTIFSYGDVGSNVDGGYYLNHPVQSLVYSIRGGSTWQAGTNSSNTEPLLAADNDVWRAICIQFDVFDGKLHISGAIDGFPQRGNRLFNLEAGLPRVASNGTGMRFLARGYNAAALSDQFVWGQTQVKRLFVGRVDGEQRHNIPKWFQQFYETATGIPGFMVA